MNISPPEFPKMQGPASEVGMDPRCPQGTARTQPLHKMLWISLLSLTSAFFFFFLRAYPSIQGTLQAAREEKETLLPGGGLMVCCFPHLQLRDLTHPHWGVLQHRNQPALQSTVFPLSLC